jgi:hypothetical protein
MRNLILFLALLFSSVSFGQSYSIELDSTQNESIKNYGFYTNKIDFKENRLDTLISGYFKLYSPENRIVEDNIIVFYELDNLLVVENNIGVKKFYFIDFLYERVSEFSITKYFSSNIGIDVTINYSKFNSLTKEFVQPYITHIKISPNTNNSYTYFIGPCISCDID